MPINLQLGTIGSDFVHVGVDHLTFPAELIHGVSSGHFVAQVVELAFDAIPVFADALAQKITAALIIAQHFMGRIIGHHCIIDGVNIRGAGHVC